MGGYRGICALLGVLSVAVVAAACGGGAQEDRPERAAASFYDALKQHDAAAACRILTPRVVREMERPTHQTGKPCIPALRRIFALVSASAFPRFFDDEPSVVGPAQVDGDRASVAVRHGKQTRSMGLRRIQGRWKISVSPGFR